MKKVLAFILAIVGVAGLIYGVVMVFNGEVAQPMPWIGIVLGGIFFSSGIGLLKTTDNEELSS